MTTRSYGLGDVEQRERVGAALCFDDAMAKLFEHGGGDATDIGVIVDEEDVEQGDAGERLGGRGAGEPDLGRGPFAQLARQMEGAA